MKKNSFFGTNRSHKKRIKLLGVMTVMVLITSSFIGSAMAKYSTKVTGTATTYVAKWTFAGNETLDLSGLFSTEYSAYHAKSMNPDSRTIVAPGTEGSVDLQLVSANASWPEVAYTLAISLKDSSTGTSFDQLGIQWCINGDGNWQSSIDSFNTYMYNTYFAKPYNPGEGPSKDSKVTISWRWPAVNSRDAEDTAAGLASDNETLGLTVSVDATQVKEGHGE